jgi:phage FluMu gp28-like protein
LRELRVSRKVEEKSNIAMLFYSPVLFVRKILGYTPTIYQAKILEDDSSKILIVGGRQIGKSSVLAWKSLWNAFVKPNQEVLIIAPTFRQAEIVFSKIRELIDSNLFLKSKTIKENMSEIRFDNNSVIRCLPAGYEGVSVRGFSATMIIFDEASLIPDEVFVALKPSMAVKGEQYILSGTPYGKRGVFYQSYLDALNKRGGWSLHIIKSEESPFIEKSFLEEMKRSMTRAQYSQEFEAEFIAETGEFFPAELILKNSKDYEYRLPKADSEGKYYMGVDVARTGEDETAFVVVKHNEEEDSYEVVWAQTRSKMLINEVAGEIVSIYKNSKIDRIFVDATGLGAGLRDILAEKLGDDVVVGVVFSHSRRNEMYNKLKALLEQGRIVLNINDSKMRFEFSSYTAKYSSNGNLIISKSADMHDDLIDALALSISGESMKVEVATEIFEFVNNVSGSNESGFYRWEL